MASKQSQNQGDVIRSFTLGNKELEGKTVEFQYDRGQYSITDVVGEERSIVYRSRNAQEAYTKWNVYIGRKKERPERAERVTEEASNEDKQGRSKDNEKRRESDNARKDREESNRQERSNAHNINRENKNDKENTRFERTNYRDKKDKENNRKSRDNNKDNERPRSGGYNQGFTAQAEPTEPVNEKKYRRPRYRKNNRKGQEK